MESPEVEGSWPEARSVIDEALLEIGDFFVQMSDIDGYFKSEEGGFALQMEKVTLDIPMQLEVYVSENGKVKIGGSPPLYYVETTVLPVFHQAQVSIEIDLKTDD